MCIRDSYRLLGAWCRSDGVVGDLDAYDLGRGIVGRKLPEVGVVEGFGHTEPRRDELRIDRAARSHRIEEEPLALAGLRDERVERPDIVRTGARRRRRGCNPFKDGFLSDHPRTPCSDRCCLDSVSYTHLTS